MLVRVLISTLFLVGFATGTDYDHSPTAGPQNGWLVIDGGGRIEPAIVAQFVKLAGGQSANFVVIPTATPDSMLRWRIPLWQALYSCLVPSFVPERQLRSELIAQDFTQVFGVRNVTVLHTRDRNRANSPDFVEPLRHASGVWLWGGRQWRLADAYLGTAVEREIKALIVRGGVVGGESAGATIQGSYLSARRSSTSRLSRRG
jgi:cyanophycinase